MTLTVPDLLVGNAVRTPTKACVVGDDRTLTFAQCHDRATRFAAAASELGVRAGDRVAMLAFNEPEFLEIQVGCQRLGATLVPLNYRLAIPELAHLIDAAGISLLVHGPGLQAQAEVLAFTPTVFLGHDGIGEPYEHALERQSARTWHGAVDAATPATVLYTSGTTGRPKGAVVSNAGLVARMTAFDAETRTTEDDVFLSTLPMFHIASNLAYQFSFYGATVHIMRQTSPPAVVERIEAAAVTQVNVVPTVLNAIRQLPAVDSEPFRSLRLVIYGASPIAPAVLSASLDLFGCGFLQLYGMTETSACVALPPSAHSLTTDVHLLAAAGRDMRGYETRVVDPDGHDAGVDEVGEIVARGPGLMLGYWNDPTETAAAMRDGWMHTGDLGRRDGAGYTYVVDRLKDMIVTGGENVYPREVEDVLQRHPDVTEVAVIGAPDATWGERVHAVVTPRPGTTPAADDLIAFVRACLAGYKTPKTVQLCEQLPKTATGKVDKVVLRKALPRTDAGGPVR